MGVLYIGHTKVGEFVFANKYKVTLTGEHCTFIGSGYHNYSLMITIEAIPELGYKFYSWGDGNTENPRLIRIDGDIELLAKVDLYYIHYTATADISDTMPTNWGDATLVNDSCTYNPDTLEGSLAFLNGPTEISQNAFKNNYYITSISIPDSITSIGSGGFSGCYNMSSITLNNSLWVLLYGVFEGCSSLASIVIPNSVYSIYRGAFGSCSSLTSITIPNSVTSIDDDVFRYCTSLTSIVVERGNITYDSRDNCNAIIKTEKNILVCGCKSTIIPNSIISIGTGAFKGCSGLTSVTIPNSVTFIGYSAFSGCSGLTSIIYNGTIKLWDAITKINGWDNNIPATVVHCTDGDVSLT